MEETIKEIRTLLIALGDEVASLEEKEEIPNFTDTDDKEELQTVLETVRENLSESHELVSSFLMENLEGEDTEK